MTQHHCPICRTDVTPDRFGDCPDCGYSFETVPEPAPQERASGRDVAGSAARAAPLVLAEKRQGQLTGARLTIEREVLVGRADGGAGSVDIDLSSFPDNAVSRRHARLRPVGEEWQIQDLGSTCGTFVNGQRLGSAPSALRQGDTLALGNLLFLVQLQQE